MKKIIPLAVILLIVNVFALLVLFATAKSTIAMQIQTPQNTTIRVFYVSPHNSNYSEQYSTQKQIHGSEVYQTVALQLPRGVNTSALRFEFATQAESISIKDITIRGLRTKITVPNNELAAIFLTGVPEQNVDELKITPQNGTAVIVSNAQLFEQKSIKNRLLALLFLQPFLWVLLVVNAGVVGLWWRFGKKLELFLKKIFAKNKSIAQERTGSLIQRINQNKLYTYFFILGIFSVIFSVLYIFLLGLTGITSDPANANILAREMLITKSWLPSTFIYSNEVYFFFFQHIIVFLSLFSSNQLLLRAISVFIFYVLFLIFIHNFHKRIFNDMYSFISLAILFSGISFWFNYEMLVEAVYLPLTLYALLPVFFLVIAYDKDFVLVNKKALIAFICITLFNVSVGTRTLATTYMPLLLTVFTFVILENIDVNFEDNKKQIFDVFKVLLIILSCVVVGLGLFYLVQKKYTIHKGAGYTNYNVTFNVAQLIKELESIFGYRPNVTLFSIHGIINALKIFGLFVFMFVGPFVVFLNYKSLSYRVKFVSIFNFFSTIIIYFLFTFTVYIGTARYLIFNLTVSILLSVYFFTHFIFKKGFYVKFLAGLFLSFFIFSGWLFYTENFNNLTIRRQNSFSVVNFLKSKNLEWGYATYWNANNNTVLSDFNIEINPIYFDTYQLPSPFVVAIVPNHYLPNSYKGRTFLMLDSNEQKNISRQILDVYLGEPNEILTHSGYYFYVYDFNISERLPSMKTEGEGKLSDNFSVEFILHYQNSHFKTGEKAFIPVIIKNNSENYFTAYNSINLSYHLLDSTKNMLQWDNVRTPVFLEPLSENEVLMQVELPTKSGKYYLEIDMVYEGNFWFAQKDGNSTALIEIIVE